jgi:hypothetical protein
VADYDPARPWVRQPFDTDLTWPLFQAFLALPLPRRLGDLLRQARGLDRWQLDRIAWADGWEARAWAWDRHLDQVRIETVERVTAEDARARAERQARPARKILALVEREVDALLTESKRLATSGGILGLIPAKDLARTLALAVRTERLALGDSTEHVQESGPDLSGFSLEQLRALRELQEAAGER